MEENAPKVIFPIEDDMPKWKKWLYTAGNMSPAFVWFIVCIYFIRHYSTSLVLSEYRDLYLNTTFPAILLAVLTFIATTILLTAGNPWIRPRPILNGTSEMAKLGLFIYWGICTLATAIVIYAAN